MFDAAEVGADEGAGRSVEGDAGSAGGGRCAKAALVRWGCDAKKKYPQTYSYPHERNGSKTCQLIGDSLKTSALGGVFFMNDVSLGYQNQDQE